MKLSARDLLRLRLGSQRLTSAPRGSAVEVVARMFAVQAQDFAQALWAVGVRCGETRAQVLGALERREIVRSWPMRGTLHFTQPDDLRALLLLTEARTTRGLAGRHAQLGLDEATLRRAEEVAAALLEQHGALGRDAFTAGLEAAGVSMASQRGPHVIGHLARRQLLVWGPPHGTQQALVLFDRWAQRRTSPTRDEALHALALRYIAGHGPATHHDLAWWSGVTLGDAKRALEMARTQLLRCEVAGVEHWVTREAADDAPRHPAAALLLPGFDEYLLGYRERAPALADEYASRIVPGGNGIFLPMIVARGRIVGTWRRATSAKSTTVSTFPFETLSASEARAIANEVERFGRYLGAPVRHTASE